jgi:hypothetical protein
MRDKSIYAFSLITEYFECDLDKHLKVDYYFYMFLNGLIPKYIEGKPINIHNDVIQQNLNLSPGIIPELENILPKDQLAVNTLYAINQTLAKLKINPRKGSIILYYACPHYMITRVKTQHKKIIRINHPDTQLPDIKRQPIENTDLMFTDSISSLIGLHKNIIGIVLWKRCETLDNTQQMLGRCMRLNTFNTPLYFYITATSIDFA